jgi:predicted lipoprotein with Yx(FWY)xxD motif
MSQATTRPTRLLPAALAALLLCGAAHAADAVMKKDGILVNAAGMTVYTFDKDAAASGKSACNGPCADNWPAVPAPAGVAAPYSVVTRDDGAKQLAYQGKPLYLYKADLKPGERHGDNFKNLWHVVKD